MANTGPIITVGPSEALAAHYAERAAWRARAAARLTVKR